MVGILLLVGVVMALQPHPPPPPPPAPPANTATNDAGNTAVATTTPVPAPANTGGPDTTPVRAADPQAVKYYEAVLTPNGPPAQLAGATVISTDQLVQAMRDRDAGQTNFYIVDARGCGDAQTIPSAVCLPDNDIDQLVQKVPDRSTQLVFFCHDGACPLSYNFANAAVLAGYTNVFWYRGGINAWMAAGMPTSTRSSADQ